MLPIMPAMINKKRMESGIMMFSPPERTHHLGHRRLFDPRPVARYA